MKKKKKKIGCLGLSIYYFIIFIIRFVNYLFHKIIVQ